MTMGSTRHQDDNCLDTSGTREGLVVDGRFIGVDIRRVNDHNGKINHIDTTDIVTRYSTV